MVFLQGMEEWAFFQGAGDLIYQRITQMYHLGTPKVSSEAVTFSVSSFFFFLMCSCLQLFSNCILVNREEKLVSINASWRGASFCLIKQLRTHIGNDTSIEHFNSVPWPLANSFCGQPIFHQSGKSCNILTTAELSAIHSILWYDLCFNFFFLKNNLMKFKL